MDSSEERPTAFAEIATSVYLTEIERSAERAFPCECSYSPGGESDACGPACINRALYIECNPRECPCGDKCQNQRFQRRSYAPLEVFRTEGKGFGLRSTQDLPKDAFVIEYVGEVVGQDEFATRASRYRQEDIPHFYFMTVGAAQIIDATKRGNISRFMNHSCNPNCVTQKWLVGGLTRIGLFTRRAVKAGQELSFDYKFVRFGQSAQRCLCGEPSCKGFIGVVKDESGAIQKSGISERLRTSEDVTTLAKTFLHSSPDIEVQRELLRSLKRTADSGLLREFMQLHGLRILCTLLQSSDDIDLAQLVLEVLEGLPIVYRNGIDEVGLPGALKRQGSLQAQQLLARWSALEHSYRIPKGTSHIPNAPISNLLAAPSEFESRRKRTLGAAFVAPQKTSPPPRRQPLPAPHAPRVLPHNWQEVRADDGAIYYYNEATQRTQWDFPAEDLAPAQPVSEGDVQQVIERARARALSAPAKEGSLSEDEFRSKVRELVTRRLLPHREKLGDRLEAVAGKLVHAILDKDGRARVFDRQKETKMKAYVDAYLAGHGYK